MERWKHGYSQELEQVIFIGSGAGGETWLVEAAKVQWLSRTINGPTAPGFQHRASCLQPQRT